MTSKVEEQLGRRLPRVIFTLGDSRPTELENLVSKVLVLADKERYKPMFIVWGPSAVGVKAYAYSADLDCWNQRGQR